MKALLFVAKMVGGILLSAFLYVVVLVVYKYANMLLDNVLVSLIPYTFINALICLVAVCISVSALALFVQGSSLIFQNILSICMVTLLLSSSIFSNLVSTTHLLVKALPLLSAEMFGVALAIIVQREIARRRVMGSYRGPENFPVGVRRR